MTPAAAWTSAWPGAVPSHSPLAALAVQSLYRSSLHRELDEREGQGEEREGEQEREGEVVMEREEEREVEEYTGLVGRSLARRMLLYRQG